ncbi:MAG: RNA methyltransferase [Patescibacteria group bacterium]|nr:RNA methyltransferase [Patescibacteria group bacterium]
MANARRIKKIKQVISSRQRDFIVVLEDIHDPHNAAAVLRTAEAFGVPQVYFVFEQEKPYNPRRVGRSSSASANKWLELKVFRSTEKCISALKKSGYKIYGTAISDNASSIFTHRFYGKVALFFGNEHRGLSETALRASDEKLVIPMRGMVQSLNISVTAAICIFEVSRQRRVSGKEFGLTPFQQKHLFKILR